MDFVKVGVAFFLAEMVAIFGLCQIFIALRVAFPFTKFIEMKYGGIDGATIRKRATATVIIWIIILGGIAAALLYWGDRMVLAGAGAAFVLAILISFGKCKPSPQTVSDYLSAYGSLISQETREELAKNALESML